MTDVVVIAQSGRTEEEMFSLAAGVESRSAHPLAEAMVRAAVSHGITAAVVDEVDSLTGQGIRATSNGKIIWIGNQQLMEEANMALSADALQQGELFQKAGKTLVWIAEDTTAVGLIALADTLRREAAPMSITVVKGLFFNLCESNRHRQGYPAYEHA